MALFRFIYGVITEYLCFERVLHVHYISIDDLMITTPLKKDKATLWSCSGRPGASRARARFHHAAEPFSENGDEADFTFVRSNKQTKKQSL